KWGINLHYSIEFAPILTIAFAIWIYDSISQEGWKKKAFLFGAIITFIVTFSVIDARKAKWYDSKTLRLWDKRHYTRDFDVEAIHSYLKLIPKDAKVCAQNILVPHLAFRE